MGSADRSWAYFCAFVLVGEALSGEVFVVDRATLADETSGEVLGILIESFERVGRAQMHGLAEISTLQLGHASSIIHRTEVEMDRFVFVFDI